MKVIFEMEDMERIYDRKDTHGYLNSKLEKANNNLLGFYGELDTINRGNFMALVGIPNPAVAERYVTKMLKLSNGTFNIVNVIPHFERGLWSTRVVFMTPHSDHRHAYDVWFQQGEIYGEW